MTSVSLASIIKLSGAASSTSDSVIPSKRSLSRELLMACWTTLSRSRPAQQGWFSLKQWMCPSSDPSTATVSTQLLNELIIIVLSKPSHAARIHLTLSLRAGARMFPAAVKEWASPASHSTYFSVTFALKGLFQTMSGAWVYFVQPPGRLKDLSLTSVVLVWLFPSHGTWTNYSFEGIMYSHGHNSWETQTKTTAFVLHYYARYVGY